MSLAAGQMWSYRAPQGFECSRMIIGAIASFEEGKRIVCCAISQAPQKLPDGTFQQATIPFLPMSEEAFLASVTEQDGTAEPPPEFADALRKWDEDPRGHGVFTVPFEGNVEDMIAQQMAALAGRPAA